MSAEQLKLIRVTALLDLSLAINSALTLDNIFDAVHDTVYAHFHTDQMYLFMQREASHRDFTLQSSFGGREPSALRIADSGALAEFFGARREPVLRSALPTEVLTEVVALEEITPELIVPCYSKDELSGVLVMGPPGQGAYHEDDIHFFIHLGQVLGAALENARLMQAATFDARTGLYNYHAARPRVLKEMYRAERYHHDLSVIMLDIDYFKKLNDTYGHLAGDRVLADYGVRIRRQLRQSDLPVRYGGEEFLIVCPHQSTDSALHLARRIREAIISEPFELPEKVQSTASMGVAGYRAAEKESLEDLLKRADAALYESKHAGRDRITVA